MESRAEMVLQGVEPIGGPGESVDGRVLVDEHSGELCAEAFAGSGDDGNGVGEIHTTKELSLEGKTRESRSSYRGRGRRIGVPAEDSVES